MDRISLILETPGQPDDRFNFETAPYQSDQTVPHLLTLRRLPRGDVYRQSHGRGIDDLRLMGTFGLAEREWEGITVDGTALFFLLKQLYEKYLALMNSADETVRRGTRLQYHHWDENVHQYCEITSFRQPRSAANKIHYLYEMDLQLHTPIKRTYNETPQPKRDAARKQVTALEAASAQLQSAASTLASLRADVVDKINRDILQPYRKLSGAIASVISEGLDFVPVAIGELRGLLNAVDDALDLIPDLLTSQLVETAQALDSLRRPMLNLLSRPELLKQSVEDAQAALNALTIQDEAAFAPKARGVRAVQTRANDTLPKIAARELGDPERWTEIALLNGLTRPPYLADAASVLTGQAAWGETLLIPSTDESLSPANVGALASDKLTYERDQERRFYGVDLKLRETAKGKLDILLDGSSADPALVGGRENVLQAITLKTRIFQGQLLENPTWGLRRLVGERVSQEQMALARWGLEEAAQSDPRVASARVDLRAEGNVADAEFDVQLAKVQAANLTAGTA